MNDTTLKISRTIDAPIGRVWRAWTTADDLKHWFTAMDGSQTQIIQFEVKVGGKVRLKFPGAAGEYTWTWVKIDRPNELVFDIIDFSLPDHQGAGGICNVSFKAQGEKTEVTLWGDLPDEMDNEPMRKMAEKGWGGTFDRLNNYLREK